MPGASLAPIQNGDDAIGRGFRATGERASSTQLTNNWHKYSKALAKQLGCRRSWRRDKAIDETRAYHSSDARRTHRASDGHLPTGDSAVNGGHPTPAIAYCSWAGSALDTVNSASSEAASATAVRLATAQKVA